MKKIDLTNKRILISRTDSIGDVMLTLPMCHWIKQTYPTATIIFLGKKYTQPIISSYQSIDEFVNWDEFETLPTVSKIAQFRAIQADVIIHVFPNKDIAALAKKVQIPVRVGTSHRAFHLLTCNYKVNFTRKRSPKHEAQLNFELLAPFGYKETPSFEEINATTVAFQPMEVELPKSIAQFIAVHPTYYILHPKSQGSALEWPLEKYSKLAKTLTENGIAVVYTGTEKEGAMMRGYLPKATNIVDTTGKLTLNQLMVLIKHSKGIVACSTGPLHIGGFLGVQTIGLYSNRKPIHPGRWQPVGANTHALVYDENCATCAKGTICHCIEKIEVEKVSTLILQK